MKPSAEAFLNEKRENERDFPLYQREAERKMSVHRKEKQ